LRKGKVFVEYTENTGFPGFGLCGQGDNPALRGRRRLLEERMQLAGSKDSGSVYSDREVQNGNAGQNGNPRLIEVKEKKTSLSGSKTHPLWYADVGREAKKGDCK
jgi:hypothetical protein